MTHQRIAPLDPPYSADIAEDFGKLMPPGMPPLTLFRTVAHNPRVLRRMRRGGLLDKGSITAQEREIMILRTCVRCGSEYEWGVHAAFFGRTVGLSDAQIDATVNADATAACWSEQQALLIRLADILHETSTVPDSEWEKLATYWQPAQLIELVMLAGLYHAVSYITNAARITPEAMGRRFPKSVAA